MASVNVFNELSHITNHDSTQCCQSLNNMDESTTIAALKLDGMKLQLASPELQANTLMKLYKTYLIQTKFKKSEKPLGEIEFMFTMFKKSLAACKSQKEVFIGNDYAVCMLKNKEDVLNDNLQLLEMLKYMLNDHRSNQDVCCDFVWFIMEKACEFDCLFSLVNETDLRLVDYTTFLSEIYISDVAYGYYTYWRGFQDAEEARYEAWDKR